MLTLLSRQVLQILITICLAPNVRPVDPPAYTAGRIGLKSPSAALSIRP